LTAAPAGVRPSVGTAVVLTLLVVFWASAFPAIKLGLAGMGPAHLTLARHLVASIAFLGFLIAFRSRPWPAWRDVPRFVGLGAIGITTYHLALNFGEVHVSAGASSLIIATAPALTALVAWWLTGDRLPPLGWWGSAVALAGWAWSCGATGTWATCIRRRAWCCCRRSRPPSSRCCSGAS
jgi:drug/metabolite transporter (DMT)-like permease